MFQLREEIKNMFSSGRGILCSFYTVHQTQTNNVWNLLLDIAIDFTLQNLKTVLFTEKSVS